MPGYFRQVLEERKLMQSYNKRPAHQRNDCIVWLERARKLETRQRRLDQMLNELTLEGVFMGIKAPTEYL